VVVLQIGEIKGKKGGGGGRIWGLSPAFKMEDLIFMNIQPPSWGTTLYCHP